MLRVWRRLCVLLLHASVARSLFVGGIAHCAPRSLALDTHHDVYTTQAALMPTLGVLQTLKE